MGFFDTYTLMILQVMTRSYSLYTFCLRKRNKCTDSGATDNNVVIVWSLSPRNSALLWFYNRQGFRSCVVWLRIQELCNLDVPCYVINNLELSTALLYIMWNFFLSSAWPRMLYGGTLDLPHFDLFWLLLHQIDGRWMTHMALPELRLLASLTSKGKNPCWHLFFRSERGLCMYINLSPRRPFECACIIYSSDKQRFWQILYKMGIQHRKPGS